MSRESRQSQTKRARQICSKFHERYSAFACPLKHSDPFTLTIAVLLSAQTTDVQVNSVTPELFRRWPTPEAMAAASPTEIEEIIHPIGFYRTKAAHCVACAQMIAATYNGRVPRTMHELTKLPGVGRKTANIVLTTGYGIVEGIAVDTHVFRIAARLGFTRARNPSAAEKDLLAIIPRSLWKTVNHEWIQFGRTICTARKPLCASCFISKMCPSYPLERS